MNPQSGKTSCNELGMTQDIGELEQRISAAFGRMDRALEAMSRARAAEVGPEASAEESPVASAEASDIAQTAPEQTSAPPPHMAALLRALETAKATAADWAERYSKLQAQMGEETFAMASEIARLTAELDGARAGLSAPSADVASEEAPIADRDAEIDELTARLAAQEAELEMLRAARAAEASELGELIGQLAPLVEEASHV